MRTRKVFFLIVLLTLLSFVSVSYVSNGKKDDFPSQVKVALRDVGNKLVYYNNDSTSLILPVLELDKNNFELSFQNNLFIVPDSLVNSIRNSFKAFSFPENYIVEVLNCDTKEVSYSYQITKNVENNIIPCLGRNLPMNCYKINVLFTRPISSFISYKNYTFLSLVLIGFIGFGLVFGSKGKNGGLKDEGLKNETLSYSLLGGYRFYKDQNKLVKDNLIIKLTSKECELIRIFSENPNQIIKREVLIKEVWEDNGIFVDRSLDTFISKIRKKFKNDDTINIVNIHGVGYKLEILLNDV